MKWAWLYVFVGGGLGSMARYYISQSSIFHSDNALPVATLASNILACFFMGLCSGLLSKSLIDERLAIFLMTGFCGGFSTFSSFSKEKLDLLQSNELSVMFMYFTLSVILGMVAVFIGWFSARAF